jgi:hypothetical protein
LRAAVVARVPDFAVLEPAVARLAGAAFAVTALVDDERAAEAFVEELRVTVAEAFSASAFLSCFMVFISPRKMRND